MIKINNIISRIETLGILFLCFLRFAVYGRADKKINNPQKVLVVQMAKLGDMVCTTPMFRAIQGAEVYVLGDKTNQQLLAGNEDVDKYLVYGGFWQTIKILKREEIDFACVTAPIFKYLALLYLSGIKSISAPTMDGYCPLETKSYNFLKKLVIVKTHKLGNYAAKEYLKLLEPIGIFTDDTKKHLVYSDNKISFKNTVIIAPSAGNKLKVWGGKRFARLADLIFAGGSEVAVVGCGEDKKYIDEMIGYLSKDTMVTNFCDKLSINEVKALIAQSDFFIGADTGLIYIAEAFDIPTIDITGPVDEKEQPPMGGKHQVIFNDVYCRPCSFVMNTARKCKNTKAPFACFDIDPAEIYQLYKEMKQTT